jgi:hypothetical protein
VRYESDVLRVLASDVRVTAVNVGGDRFRPARIQQGMNTPECPRGDAAADRIHFIQNAFGEDLVLANDLCEVESNPPALSAVGRRGARHIWPVEDISHVIQQSLPITGDPEERQGIPPTLVSTS